MVSPVTRRRPAAARSLCLLLLGVVLAAVASACTSIASPQGWADPVFAGNTIYFSGSKGQLEAYDRDAKKILWTFPNAATKQLKLEGIYSTPTLDDQALYFGAYNGNIYALDRSSGALRWGFNTGSPIIGGLLLKDGTLYAGNSDGHVLALRATNGDRLWQQSAGRRVWSTPIDAGSLIVVPSMDKYVYAFDTQGKLAWKSNTTGAAIASTPLLEGQTLTFGAFDKRFHAIQVGNGKQVWASPEAGNWFWTRGLISGDNLYAGNLDGQVYAFKSATGELAWKANLGSPVRSAPALVQGVLVVAGRNGLIHGLDPASGQEKWPAIDAGGTLLANLILQNDTLYALTEAGGKGNPHLLQIDAARGAGSNVLTP
ncbi:MAG: PQQ-binding-like beta-propeller repeat protein [Dehalococcoidia bacterium]